MTNTARIIRFEVPVDDQWHTVVLPAGADILHVACRRADTVEFWVEQWLPEKADGTRERRFRVHGTGHQYDPTACIYVGTAIYRGTGLMPGAWLVWHLLEGKEVTR
jgi:hypothetical protein